MIDVKKLIAGFLILATGAGSSVLIFSYLGSLRANSGSSSELMANSNLSPVSGNAFLPQSQSEDMGSTLTPDVTNSPDNITGNLTDTLLNGIMAANPQGPATDANGNPIMTPPDQAKMLADLSNNAALKNFKAPNWDTEADAITLNIAKNYSHDDVTAYIKAIGDITENNFIQSGAQDSLTQALNGSDSATSGLDPSLMSTFAPLTTDALNKIANLKTPDPLARFQKSLVRLLVYEKNIAKLADNLSEDPVKTSLIINIEEKNANLAAQNLQNELQKALQSGAFAVNDGSRSGLAKNEPTPNSSLLKDLPNGLLAAIKNLFAIKIADAQDAAGQTMSAMTAHTATVSSDAAANAAAIGNVPVNNPSAAIKQTAKDQETFTNTLEEFASKLALQILKNSLIYFIQNKVLVWIQGSGAPRFITSWADTFVNAAQAAAVSALNRITPNICPSFSPLINAALKVTTPSIVSGFQTCTMSTANMKIFYTDFSSGGWNSYFNMLQPNNNFYSQLMVTQDAVEVVAANQAAATQAKSIAAQGYIGDQICVDGSDPNGVRCVNDNTGEIFNPNNDGFCDQEETAVPNNGLCANGSEPKTTTPGQMTAAVSAKALGSSIDLAVSANDITGIAVALTESLMTGLMNSAQKTINNQINQIGGSGILSVLPLSSPTNSISCIPASTTVSIGSPFSVTATGGKINSNYNPPTYTWSAPGASPATFTGAIFTGTYNSVGTHDVTVTASTDKTTATCEIVVTIPLTPVSCSPAGQTISAGSSASISATGGNSTSYGTGNPPAPTYTWNAPGAVNTKTTTSTFTGTYNATGAYGVTVSASDNTSLTCQVIVQ